jgi:hypothetical protein
VTLRAALLAVGLALFGATGCSSPPAPPATVFIRVLDETKAPVLGAQIVTRGEVVTATDKDGHAEISLTGREGTSFEVEVRCPALYRSPGAPLVVRRMLTNEAPEYVARCSRLRHTLAVTIHTTGGSNMPILHLGKEVARTDETGTARVVIEGQVQERIDLTIDTSDPKFAKLHPQNPLASFEIGQKDDAQAFEMKFTADKPPPKRIVRRTGPKQF